ncbi:hypothetical protein JCM21900_006347 [Sporobolomyces salmonicolor]
MGLHAGEETIAQDVKRFSTAPLNDHPNGSDERDEQHRHPESAARCQGWCKAPKKTIKGNKGPAGGDNKRKKKRKEAYLSYVYKVLNQVHPDTGISNKAMLLLNPFVNDIFERIAAEADKLASYNKKCTSSSREVQTSVKLILPGELSKHAICEGTKGVTKSSSDTK